MYKKPRIITFDILYQILWSKNCMFIVLLKYSKIVCVV